VSNSPISRLRSLGIHLSSLGHLVG
jgi:hypothetical protein